MNARLKKNLLGHSAWRATHPDRESIKRRVSELEAELFLDTVQPNLWNYFTKRVRVIYCLLAHDGGKEIRTYTSIQGNAYDFETLDEFAERFETLKKAWKDVIEVKIEYDRGPEENGPLERIHLTFTLLSAAK